MPRQTRSSAGSALPESSTGADAKQSEPHENCLDNQTSRTTELQQRLNQIAEELRQMQERPAPKPAPAPAAVPAVPVETFEIDPAPFCGGSSTT